MDKQSRIILLLVLLLLLASTGLRLYRLNEGLWLDEILTYVRYARLPLGDIVRTFDSENQHFLYSILASLSFQIFGESGWALRLPAVLFGVGSILTLYLLGREVAGSREGLLAAALMAFSYHHLWFSQNARGYTGMLFWTLLSSWFMLRGLKNGRLADWLVYGASAALGAYTHLTMGFVIFGQFIVAALANFLKYRRRELSGWSGLVAGFICAGVLIGLLHLPVIGQMQNVIGGSEASVVAEWKSPLWTIMEFINGLKVGFSLGIVGLIAIFVLIVGMMSYWKSYPEVIGLLLIPALTGAAVTLAIGHHLWPRFFFFAFGFGALVIIRGVMEIGTWLGKRLRLSSDQARLVGLVGSVLLIVLSALSMPLAYGPKQDYQSALAYLEQNRTAGEQVVTVSIAALPLRELYHQDWAEVTSLDELSQIQQQDGSTWLVYTFPEVLASVYPDIMGRIQQDFTLQAEFPGTVRSGTVYIVKSN